MIHYTRIQSLMKAIKENHYTDLIISNPTTIAYLTSYQNFDPGERLFILHLNEKGAITLYLNRLFPEPYLLLSIVISFGTVMAKTLLKN